MKKLFLLLFLVYTPFAYGASLDLTLDLETSQYGSNQNFLGDIILDYTGNISVNKEIEARIRNGGSNTYRVTLGDLVDDSYIFNDEKFERISSKTSMLFQDYPSYFGILLDDEATLARFTLRGEEADGNYPNNVLLDIGNDEHIDWQYAGPFKEWSRSFYTENISGDETPLGEVLIKGGRSFDKCDIINISLNEMFNATQFQIGVRASKIADGGNLKASVDGPGFSQECDLPEPGESMQEVICEVTNNDPESGEYEVCVFSSEGSVSTNYYKIPRIRVNGEDAYFLHIKIAEYETELHGETLVEGISFISGINDYYNSFCSGTCLIPISIISEHGILNISNLYTEDREGRIVNSFSEVSYKEKELVIKQQVKLPLEKFPNLKTPSKKEEYKLQIRFQGEDDEKTFSVVDAPTARIYIPRYNVAQGEHILFSGEGSSSPNGAISSWEWDFGDNTTEKGALVSQGINKVTVYVGHLEDLLDDLLNDTLVKIEETHSSLASASLDIKETSRILGYQNLIESAKANLTGFSIDYKNIKNSAASDIVKQQQYLDILEKVESLKKIVPYRLTQRIFTYTGLFPNKEDFPDPTLFKTFASAEEQELYLTKMYEFNFGNVQVNLHASDVSVVMLSGETQHFALVKKDITIDGVFDGILIEDLRNVVDDEDEITVITAGSTSSNRMIQWPIQRSMEILYLLEDVALEKTQYAFSVVYSDVELPLLKPSFEVYCGDDICEYNEEFEIDENNPGNIYFCKKDCRKEFPLWIGVVLGIVLIAGIFFFNFYRGPGSLKRKAPEKQTVVTDEYLIRLRTYIRESLERGFGKEEITNVLLEKGWDKKYIEEGFQGLQ